MNTSLLIQLGYIGAAVLFIFGLKMLASPASARKGNLLSALGMFLAVAATLMTRGLDLRWIALGTAVGAVIGARAARRVAMTAMPEMVALFNGSGGVASLLVGWAVYHGDRAQPLLTATTIVLSVLIGGVTFSGSFMAWGKLSGALPGRPVLYKGQHVVNLALIIAALAAGAGFVLGPQAGYPLFLGVVLLALFLGVCVVLPIGGADMPVVISLLNSYSGLAACAAGFVIQNTILIVAGSLVGASGLILTNIMCKAMNRPLSNVLFSGFGAVEQKRSAGVVGEAKPINVQDAYFILEAARSVVVVPGYGLAVAQAQHALRELGELLEKNGAEVRYVIHPVAGRMPGHMNVLLAEANVPYEQLYEMETVNPIMDTVDVAIVVGANDVVNPAARHDKSSPIYGMPIVEVDRARTVLVLKRSLGAGFAGIPNELFYKDNTRMLFGDAKASLQGLVAEFKEAS